LSLTKAELVEALRLEQCPRSAGYDTLWVIENQMGPNVLWLTEALSQVMELKPGMRILDMGCGKALSSIFLAKEFHLQVWATDLWISASENWGRVIAAGVEAQVFPIHSEAHALPFADDFFDAAVSIDAYHYFGTDDLYLGTCFAGLVKPGGQIGIVVPGLAQEFNKGVPEYLQPGWDWEFCTFHSPAWWQQHWEKTDKVVVERADLVPDGWQQWLKWQEVRKQAGYAYDESEAELLRRDAGRNLGFSRVVARRKG
jgi:cyclopropane fatty-acyl-phospholipid synthase-like methyltransferase